MATKEVMVSAPVLVLLYDRAFVGGSFRGALRARWKFYAALAATWLVLAACLLGAGFRGQTAGFDLSITWWSYALTQCRAILIYLKLVFLPSPLIFEYGQDFVASPWEVWPQVLVVALLAGAALVALFRRPRAGFCGALFFAVLAPTSSVLPIVTQTMAERRMYLPSVAVIAGVVVACWRLARKAGGAGGLVRENARERAGAHEFRGRAARAPGKRRAAALAAFAVAVAVAFGALTWRRNTVYRDEISLWLDTVEKAPRNAFAQNTAGRALIDAGRYDEGIAHCMESARLSPVYGPAYFNIGHALGAQGRYEEAIPYYQRAMFWLRERQDTKRLDGAYLLLGAAMREAGRDAEARAVFEEAVAFNPKNAPCLTNLGNYAFFAGDYAGAEKYYRRALAADPALSGAHDGLADTLAALGRDAEARGHYEEAIRLKPAAAAARYGYARLLKRLGETEAARAQAREALRLRPDYAEAAEFLKTLQGALENQEKKK